ncbi:MAG: DNA cytosine methyltransferase [Puniceicoccales bacterium]|jgi:DNA (cytosine-5)-methyltransferase 1|nr:DNA cytosine methyltransferase [Puniceicoccales bacterium]
MPPLRSIELFSGAGGLALGLEGAGFSHVGLVERNRDACATLRLNRPKWNLLETDVRKINFADFGAVEMVAGGPPCQPFSIGGKARGYDDLRDMFPQAVRAVRELRPRAFMFENVRGLMRQAFRNYVEFIRLQLTYPDFPVSSDLGWEANLLRLQRHHTSKRRVDGLVYQVSLHLADAADYGVPQRRHRVFFVGFRSDLDAKWSFPAPLCSADELLREKYVTGEYWSSHGIARRSPPAGVRIASLREPLLFRSQGRWKTVRDAIGKLPEPGSRSNLANHVFQPGARAYAGHTGSPFDEPAKALKAGAHGVPGGENMLDYGNDRVRYFSVRESARIQTFPDNYVFSGSWTESMRQLGNAVPVQLARAVASSIHRKLEELA